MVRVADYDSTHEGRSDFLNNLRGLATLGELDALRSSARARIPWRVLRTRHEQARLAVTGISRAPRSGGSTERMIVQGILTTRSDLAVVRSFECFTLTLTRKDAGWRVASADGPGL